MEGDTAHITSWLGRLDARVTRLEESNTRLDERSDHVADDLRRLEVSIQELTRTLTTHINSVDAKLDQFQMKAIGLLSALVIGVVIEGARFALEVMGR